MEPMTQSAAGARTSIELGDSAAIAQHTPPLNSYGGQLADRIGRLTPLHT